MRKSLFFIIPFLVLLTYSCNLAGSQDSYTLTTNVSSRDAGTVNPPDGEFEAGSQIEITAEPSEGFHFTRWEGDLSGSENPAGLTFDSDKNVSAVFTAREYPLNITIEGEGTVSEEVVQEKNRDYEHGTVVELTAHPAEGWNFAEWRGAVTSSENPVRVTVDEEKEITAVFRSGDYILTVEINGEGSVQRDPDRNAYDAGTEVELTADPAEDYSFIEWRGDLTSFDNPEKITMNEDTEITAVFRHSENTRGELVIMPLGNSLTNDSRSRVRLWNLLTDDGYSVDYVGDQHQESTIPDPDHEGVGGIEIQGIIDKAESLMDTHDPAYVNLMAGTNDIAWGYDEPAAEIAGRWNELVQLLLDHSGADTWVIAATIPPVTSENVGSEDMEEQDRAVMVARFNEELREHVEERSQNGDNIILADAEEALNREEHLTSDGVHLNEEGYEIMGTVYYEAILSILDE